MVPNFESFGLANRTKNIFSLFPRSIQYRERPKGPPFSFFGIVRLFEKIFSPNFFHVQFFDVLQQWMLKMRKDPSFSASSVVWIFREFDTLSFDTFMSFCYF